MVPEDAPPQGPHTTHHLLCTPPLQHAPHEDPLTALIPWTWIPSLGASLFFPVRRDGRDRRAWVEVIIIAQEHAGARNVDAPSGELELESALEERLHPSKFQPIVIFHAPTALALWCRPVRISVGLCCQPFQSRLRLCQSARLPAFVFPTRPLQLIPLRDISSCLSRH